MQPRCVILVPSHNSERTIAETLISIQSQGETLRRIGAVCLCDDASTDSTIEVARNCWRVDGTPLMVWIQDRNVGERANVNQAVRRLKEHFDWIFVLHADDIAKPHWLSLMVTQIDTKIPKLGSICSSWDDLMPNGTVIPGEDNASRAVECVLGTDIAVRATLLSGCWWHISGCAIRLAAFADVGEFEPKLPQTGDWEWLLRCLASGWTVAYIPRTLILYRNHAASLSSASFRTDLDIRESLEVIRRHWSALSTREVLAFHLRKLMFCVRRAGRALTNLNFARIQQVYMTGVEVVRSLVVGVSAASRSRQVSSEARDLL
jgi:glycosyltransferase involved in cell wall biosynthesis